MKAAAVRWTWGLAALGLGVLGQSLLLPTLACAGSGRARLVLHAATTLADVALTVAVHGLSRWYDLLGNLL